MKFKVGQEVIVDNKSPGVVVEPSDARFPNSDSMVWVRLAGSAFPFTIDVPRIQPVNEHPYNDEECKKLVDAGQAENGSTIEFKTNGLSNELLAAKLTQHNAYIKDCDTHAAKVSKETHLKECVDMLAKDNCRLSSDCTSLAELVQCYKYKISTQSEISKLQVNLCNVEEQINKLSPVFEKHILPF